MDTGVFVVFIAILAVFAILTIIFSCESISAGHVGIVKRFGAVKEGYMKPGLNGKMPFLDTVKEIDVRMKDISYASTVYSKNLQTVNTKAAVQYSLVPQFVSKMYETIGDRYALDKVIIEPAIAESLKQVTTRFTTTDLVQSRAKAKNQIVEELKKFISDALTKKKLNGLVQIANFAIKDFEFSDDFNQSIEDKIRAEQQAQQAENEQKRIVIQAEAAAQEKKIRAEATAFEIETHAKAKAEAIRSQGEALRDNPDLIQLKIAEKWNGVLPRFTGVGGVPMLDLSGMDGGSDGSERMGSKRRATRALA